MRDTLELRSKLVVLATLSAAAVGAACQTPPQPEPVVDKANAKANARGTLQAPDRDEDARTKKGIDAREKYYRAQARKQGKTFEEVAPDRVLEAIARREKKQADAKPTPKPEAGDAPTDSAADGAPKEPDRFAPIDGDPPYIEGYNPEEDLCTSGNWCAELSTVMKVAVPKSPMHAVGCPERITGARAQDDPFPTGKAFEGLSSVGVMQGALNSHGSELARERGAPADTCCYHWFEYCSGRPHIAEHGPVTAPLEPGSTWLGQPDPAADAPVEPLPKALAARLAEAWSADAAMEHASVAAFSRATLELMAVGAPAELLAGCARAALDEIEHARECFALATRYGAPPQQPGPLEPVAPRAGGLPRLAADTFAEGCVGETVAALFAERAAHNCLDPEVRRVLTRIADDEARHAALAWRTLAWALAQEREQGTAQDVAAALKAAQVALRPTSEAPPADPCADTMLRCGRLDDAAMWHAQRAAWRDIIEPMLGDLLHTGALEAPASTASA